MGNDQRQKTNEKSLLSGEEGLTFSVPINSATLHKMMEVTLPNTFTDVDVDITESAIEVSGKAQKSALTIPFRVVLHPDRAEGRLLYLRIDNESSLGSEWVSPHLFPRRANHDNERKTIVIDLNRLDIISKIRTGSVKTFEIKDRTLWVTLGF